MFGKIAVFAVGSVADAFYNIKDKSILSETEYRKAKNNRSEKRINNFLNTFNK